MADVYEKNLSQKTTLAMTDYIRVVGSDNVSYKQLVSDVADKIITQYAGATLAGSAQSVKSAIDALNSNIATINGNLGLNEIYGSSTVINDVNNAVRGVWYYVYQSAINSPDQGILISYGANTYTQVLFGTRHIFTRLKAEDWTNWYKYDGVAYPLS